MLTLKPSVPSSPPVSVALLLPPCLCEPAQCVEVVGLAGEDEQAISPRTAADDPARVDSEVASLGGAHLQNQAAGSSEVVESEHSVMCGKASQILLAVLASYLLPRRMQGVGRAYMQTF